MQEHDLTAEGKEAMAIPAHSNAQGPEIIVMVIPACQPEMASLRLAPDTRALTPAPVLPMTGGSDERHSKVLARAGMVPGVSHLQHALNLSKAAALKTGLCGGRGRRLLLPHLLNAASLGYEFEFEVPLLCKHRGVRIVAEQIETICSMGNSPRRFSPLPDSLKTCFTFMRFSAIALATALIDNAVFILVNHSDARVWRAQAPTPFVALLFNYRDATQVHFSIRPAKIGDIPALSWTCSIKWNTVLLDSWISRSSLGTSHHSGTRYCRTFAICSSFFCTTQLYFQEACKLASRDRLGQVLSGASANREAYKEVHHANIGEFDASLGRQ
jgi:hypothetical protein